jgi:protein phosphatase 1 regulatory subunit 11
MHTAIRGRRRTFVPADGSRTLTITNDPTQEDSDEQQLSSEGENLVGSLRLRGGHKRRQRVAWGEDVVDNEGCGKKKSKSTSLKRLYEISICQSIIAVCCIYHKPRRFDESSSEESSDSDSENECRHDHDHPSPRHLDGSGSSSRPQLRDGSSVVARVPYEPDPEPNAYEKQPYPKKGKRRAGTLYFSLLSVAQN